ncbi:MAG: helix-turn-helix transcriptional regulator [Clostridiaceae bacterium]|nr:helix-turn-helix transcriptional regulator [Clostridiaceae bacterium]
MKRLKDLRKDFKETQADIANLIGITRGAYANIETGKREPDLNTIGILANHYDVTVDYLLGRTDIKKRPTPKNGDEPLDPIIAQIMDIVCQMSPEKRSLYLENLRLLMRLQAQEPDSDSRK